MGKQPLLSIASSCVLLLMGLAYTSGEGAEKPTAVTPSSESPVAEEFQRGHDEWRRFWCIDSPTHLMQERTHGGLLEAESCCEATSGCVATTTSEPGIFATGHAHGTKATCDHAASDFRENSHHQVSDPETIALPGKRYYGIPICDPITESNHIALYEPSDEMVMRHLESVRNMTAGIIPNIDTINHSNMRIVKELITDYLDEPRFYPGLGSAQMHHVHYKCTVDFTEEVAVCWPVSYTTKSEDVTEVLYIDLNHLHLLNPSKVSDIPPEKAENAISENHNCMESENSQISGSMTITLPGGVQKLPEFLTHLRNINARAENGVLTIEVPEGAETLKSLIEHRYGKSEADNPYECYTVPATPASEIFVAAHLEESTTPQRDSEPRPYIVGGRQVCEVKGNTATTAAAAVPSAGIAYTVTKPEYEPRHVHVQLVHPPHAQPQHGHALPQYWPYQPGVAAVSVAVAEVDEDENNDEAVFRMIELHIKLHDVENAKKLTSFVKDKKELLEGIIDLAEENAEKAIELEEGVIQMQFESPEALENVKFGEIFSPKSYKNTAKELLAWATELLGNK